MSKCVFCERIENGEYIDRFADHVMFEPLNPVVKGHMLVVPVKHTANLNDPELVAEQTGWALRYFTNDTDEYNLITSKGANATQTIQHLHFHIVPRRANDGLTLPWTNQHTPKPIESLDEQIAQAIRATVEATRLETGDRFSKLKRVTVKANTKAIKALITEQERLARIDELKKLKETRPHFFAVCGYHATGKNKELDNLLVDNYKISAYVAKRIEQLGIKEGE